MTTSTAVRGEKRRAQILKTALALFNARGTAAVSTNHVAAELGISVGNLYWHFRDKEALVRALFENHIRQFDEMWVAPATEAEALDAAVTALRRSFAFAWDYRFFYRELATLTRADPELRKMHAAVRERRREQQRVFQRSFVELGVLRFPDGEASLERLTELAWLISTFWIPHVELRDGTITRRAVLEGARAVLEIYLPYATAEYARAVSAALARADADA
jgi:AcrR family transcriptional regulator